MVREPDVDLLMTASGSLGIFCNPFTPNGTIRPKNIFEATVGINTHLTSTALYPSGLLRTTLLRLLRLKLPVIFHLPDYKTISNTMQHQKPH